MIRKMTVLSFHRTALLLIVSSLSFFHSSAGMGQNLPFITYTTDDGLNVGTVSAIFQDADGYLWFGTYGGISKFDGQEITNYTTTHGLRDNRIQALAEDGEGRLWVATYSGIDIFNGAQFTSVTSEGGPADNNVRAIERDRAGHKWVATVNGVYEWDGT